VLANTSLFESREREEIVLDKSWFLFQVWDSKYIHSVVVAVIILQKIQDMNSLLLI
jgi:hypothetical protein